MTSLHEERLFMIYMAGKYRHVFTPRNGTVADLCAAAQNVADSLKINFNGREIKTMKLVNGRALIRTDALANAILDWELVTPTF